LNADEGENSFDSDAMSSGDDVIDTSKSAAKKSLNTRNDITGYLRRLLKHYDILASDFDKSQEKYRFMTNGNDIRQGISCNNISHILIATMLVYHRMLHPKDGEDTTGLISKYLLKILGRFFMIFRNGYVGDSEYTKTKLSDMHNNLVAYALLILTMYKYAHGDKIYKLLVLNILDSYAGKKADLRSALKNYRTLRNKHKANCIKTSMEFIDDTIKLHSSLEENMTISTISRFSENLLIYRSQFGYMFAKQVYEIKSVGATVLCSLPTIYTGYKEKTEIVAYFPTKAKQYKLR
jgi:ABC-type multidrug transport system fused ATPase/permease subunit